MNIMSSSFCRLAPFREPGIVFGSVHFFVSLLAALHENVLSFRRETFKKHM